MASSFANISIRFVANLKQFSSQMQNADRSIQKIGTNFKKVGAGLTVGLTAPISALGATAFNTFANFEDQLAKVQAVSGATESEFKALKEQAEALGSATRFTASEVGALELNLSKLGFKPGEILAATASILDLSLATGEDLATSATVAASTIRAFGLSADETQRVVDVMASSFSSSSLDLEKFSSAMGSVAPVAKNAGQSIEDTTGMLAVLVSSGIDASTAGTGLRNIFLEIAKRGINLDDALNQINTSTNKNASAMELFGKRGATVGTVLAENIKEARGFAVSFENAGGSAAAMAKIMDDTAKGSMARLTSAVEGAQIAIGNVLAPVVREIVDSLALWISKFQALDDKTKKIIVVISGLAAVVGPLLVALGFLATNIIPGLIAIMASLRGAFLALNIAMAANPIGAIVAVLGVAVGAFLLFNNSVKETAKAQNILTQVSNEAEKSISSEKTKLEQLLFAAKDEQLSKAQRIAAIKELNKISPKYLGDLTLEEINTDKARIAIENYNVALLQTAKAKAAQGKLIEIQKKIIDAEISASNSRQNNLKNEGLAERFRVLAVQNGVSEDQQRANFQNVLNTGSKLRLKNLNDEADALISIINNTQTLNKTPLVVDQNLGGGVTREKIIVTRFEGDGVGLGNSSEAIRQEIKDFESLQSAYKSNSYEYGLLANFIKLKQSEIIDNNGGLVTALAIPLPDESLKNYLLNLEKIKVMAQIVGGAVADSFANFSNSIIGSLGLANDGFEGFVKGMADTITQLIAQLLAASISQAIAGAAATGTATGPLAVISTPAFIASAVGGVLAAFASIPKFADGGLVYGPTMGLMGEYSGARNNPEVIAPLDKLKRLINPGDGVGDISGVLTADGNNLAVVLSRTNDRNKRFG
jgi:hypothetical protein